MPAYSTPGVYYEPVDEGTARVAALRTDVTGFVGLASRGPVGVPVRIASWRQFESVFGGLHPDGCLPHSVRAFFLNGGRLAYVVRVAAPPRETTALPVAQPADGTTSLVEPSGFVAGAVVTVTGEAPDVAGLALVAEVDRAGRSLVWDAAVPPPAGLWDDRPVAVHAPTGWVTLRDDAVPKAPGRMAVQSIAGFEAGQWVTVRQSGRARSTAVRLASVDLGGSVLAWEGAVPVPVLAAGALRFETGAAPAAARLDDAWGQPALEARATSPGVWATTLQVAVTASVGAATTAPADQPSDRTSMRVDDVSGFKRGDLVRVLQPGLAPAVAYAVVADVDPDGGRLLWVHPDPRRRLRWDGPLPAAVDTRRAASVERVDAAVSVYVGARLWEVHGALSLVPEHPRYAPRVLPLDGPGLVGLVPIDDAPPAEPGRLALATGTRWLEGGGDGLAALTALDMAGSLADDGGVGVAALATVDDVAILALPDAFLRPGRERVLAPLPPVERDPCLPQCEPDLVVPAPPPRPVERAPAFSADASFTIQQAAVEQCERLRDRVVLLDGPRAVADARAEGTAAVRAWRKRFDSAFAALYHPWLLVRDERAGLREVPPCGHVAGLAAWTDLTQGVQYAPAGRQLDAVQALAVDLDDALHGLLNVEGVNVLRRSARCGVRVLGARTTSSDPAWRYLNIRRLINFLAESIEHGLQWAVHEPNDERLRDIVRIAVSSLLLGVWERGGLRGRTAEEAFFVLSDGSNNPPQVTSAGQLVVDVGVAAAAPAEFIVLRVGRVAGEAHCRRGGAEWGGGLMAAPVGNYNFFIRLLDAAEAVVSLIENVFGVDIAPDAGFSECRGLEGTMQVEELPEGGLNGGVRKFATRFTWGNITLSRGVGLTEDLFRWFSSYAQGNGKRRDGVVMLLDDAGDTVAIWRFKRGLPVRWSGPTMSGKGSEVAIESLEIAHEGLELQMNPGLFGPRP